MKVFLQMVSQTIIMFTVLFMDGPILIKFVLGMVASIGSLLVLEALLEDTPR